MPIQRLAFCSAGRKIAHLLPVAAYTTIWMIAESLDPGRNEHGPYGSRLEAEVAAIRLHMPYVLRYEQSLSPEGELVIERLFVMRLHDNQPLEPLSGIYTRCATCGESARHDEFWQAEVWADIHEFEHSRHLVRLFIRTGSNELNEIRDWRRIADPTPHN